MADQLDSSQIKKFITTSPKPVVDTFAQIDSTQTYSLKHQFITPHVVIADHQTQGRGQRGHRFYSPKSSGIYMTITLPAKQRFIMKPGVLTAGLGVAVIKAIQPYVQKRINLKWMNDIYLDQRKCGGLLVETHSTSDNSIRSFVIGIGLNLYTHSFPKSIQQRAGYLFSHQPLVSRNQLIARIYDYLVKMARASDQDILNDYEKRLIWIHQSVTYQINGRQQIGRVLGIDDMARLLVEDQQQQIHHLNYRDASQVRLLQTR
ncbi:biotin--[acetyl-CoA-carboxylase] ligase [Acetilactobacillus jinshanensis]|uniref:Biotin--[acetyl-CoA-carboxylase] ligase n=1 Tax=Acetilactobacillus jinshanensis TaxID=1720083 RepID=A0A4P6ZJB8_9LACO|nr:biotin--[acetyl-CoA-carboxylase] ligase [Acetilactobacillus jinshanensis]QBP17704.1 biotin--[acetyl-CoA-carboxylase] ligase [Acetilactobacillus jinshanensis]URL61752.1 biotin--[acetyl-CoA-carboxylase] ligase [uncultured bacterium]